MQQIGRYEVEAELGRGAMGVVYLARDPRVKRRVAIKTYVLPAGLTPARAREFRERFLREAQTAGALDHPSLVTIYDAGEDPRTRIPFIAMEYVPGRNLRDLLDHHGVMPAREACAMARGVASGLQAAHDAGIIHRDIKPANILIRAGDGAAKLADFGVARAQSSDLTSTGQSLGSPAYMSPEQIRGQPVDGRSDLFSLAIVLYEALCGERPFAGEDLSALAYAVVHEQVAPVSHRRDGLPPGLDRFFACALAKAPGERFADGTAFSRELTRAVAAPSVPDADTTMAATGLLQELPRPSLAHLPGGGHPGMDFLRAVGAAGAALRPHLARGAVALLAALRRTGAALARGLQGLSSRGRRLVLAGAAILLGLLLALFLWLEPPATLTLQVKNSFPEATLTVSIDGRTAYSGDLAADRRKVKAFGRKLAEWGNQEFTRELKIAAGTHEIRVTVTPAGEAPLVQILTAELKAGESRFLKLTTGRKYGDPLELRLN
ncbi:MAG: serine/threonine protein kinase [Acidobacteria bacterium]|nr:MAG: serine/threonine protein kinase [Acidobacteriota bacterium]